jgi:hypothetical protein
MQRRAVMLGRVLAGALLAALMVAPASGGRRRRGPRLAARIV